MGNGNVAHLMVNVFDGTRRRISPEVKLLVTLTNGFHEQVHRDYHNGPSVLFKLPGGDDISDNYSVVVWAEGYEQAGFAPVRINPRVVQHVDLMLLPKDAGFNFHDARWAKLRKTQPDLARILAHGAESATAARNRYTQLMEDRAPALASLLNITTAMSQMYLPSGTSLAYIKELVWDESMRADRFFCYADTALADQIEGAVHQGIMAPTPAGLHPGATRSFKQVEFGEANLQLTLHENVEDRRIIDGVQCCKLEPDIDYYRDAAAHLLLEVLVNKVKGSLNDPRVVYILRWTAGRAAGRSEFNPPYVIV